MEGNRKRDVACKARISDVLAAAYVKTEDETPNHLDFGGEHVSRVNLIGMVVGKEAGDLNTLLLDDGTGMLRVSVFNDAMFGKADIGRTVVVIGRVREYGQERYLSAEILTAVDPLWAELRRKELAGRPQHSPEKMQEKKEDEKEESSPEKLYALIKENDDGSGADMAEVIGKAGMPDAEKMIKALLESGDVFEVQPGRLKALE